MAPVTEIRVRPLLKVSAPTLFIILLLGLLSCAREEKPPPRLSHAYPSMEALAEAILDACFREDKEALRNMALSKEEFEQFIWPELPASNPKTNVTVDFVWGPLVFSSLNQMERNFRDLKGRKLELVSVRHRGEIVEYATHRAFADMEVAIRDLEIGEEKKDYPLFGTLVEMDGVFKVYSFTPYD